MDKKVLASWTPPVLLDWYSRNRSRMSGLGWGAYISSWKEAEQKSKGYDDEVIVNKVRDSLLKVKRGEAAYERDSVAFLEPEYSWPILSCLLWIAAQNNNQLAVLDFGGSLGSLYFQHKIFLDSIRNLQWKVVEQRRFIAVGKRDFETKALKFFPDIQSSLEGGGVDVFIFSGVLQYLPKPYDFLKEALRQKPKFLILDRTAFAKDDETHLTVQGVAAHIYPGSYPCWFLSDKRISALLSKEYKLIASFDDNRDQSDKRVEFRGSFWMRLNSFTGKRKSTKTKKS